MLYTIIASEQYVVRMFLFTALTRTDIKAIWHKHKVGMLQW